MKRFSTLLLLLFFLFIPYISVYAQVTAPVAVPLPGLNCGIANDTDVTSPSNPKLGIFGTRANQCCTAIPNALGGVGIINAILNAKPEDFISGILGGLVTNIPIVGLFFSGIREGMSQAQKQLNQLQEYQKNNPGTACVFGEPNTSPTDPKCICESKDSSNANKPLAQMCYTYLSKSSELGSCVSCAAGGGMWTSLGCVPTNVQGFITTFLLSTGIGLGGIIALICIIYAAFSMQISQGNPEKIKKAQELLTSCIMGLMLIIFSVFILRLIGVNILRIPFLQ